MQRSLAPVVGLMLSLLVAAASDAGDGILWTEAEVAACHARRADRLTDVFGIGPIGLFFTAPAVQLLVGPYAMADEIVPQLWLGSTCAAHSRRFLCAHKIGLAVSMAAEWADAGRVVVGGGNQTVTFAHVVGLTDSVSEAAATVLAALLDGARRVDAHRRAHPAEGVLVYCNMGISRSASAVAMYLIQRGLDPALVSAARPWAQPNDLYLRVLDAYRSRYTRPSDAAAVAIK